jgi:hypothetical protein
VSPTERGGALEAEAREPADHGRRPARVFGDPERAKALLEGIVAVWERLLAQQE